jgi:hypothetical protein
MEKPWSDQAQVSFSIISVITGIPSLFLYGLVNCYSVFFMQHLTIFTRIPGVGLACNPLSLWLISLNRSSSDGLGLGGRLYVNLMPLMHFP